MSKKIDQSLIIALVVGALVSWAMFQFVYMAKQKQIKVLEQSLTQTKERNGRINELGKSAGYFKGLMDRVATSHNSIHKYLPNEVKLSALLRELSVLAKRNEVNVLSIKPLEDYSSGEEASASGVGEDYLRSKIEVLLDSEYDSLGSYINSIENNGLTVMTIKYIKLFVPEDRDVHSSNLSVNMIIEAFHKQ